MNIRSSDGKHSIPLGGTDTWKTLCATIRYHLLPRKGQLIHVFAFLEAGHTDNCDCLVTAREFNLVRDALSGLAPDQIVYDETEPQKRPPWGDDISPVITSCANYLTSGDGNDLLAEIVKLFTYASYSRTDVDIM